ncbi:hypothetical protein QBC43DRAFT_115655 [Cladorrhinum sp. PSN259]|nr:hypothetical protein QBC43DRAFT_115655 [Cladorrhinum sp. PSN259]
MSGSGAQQAAVITGSFLSGAMASLSIMAVPVFLDTTPEAPLLFTQWARMYHYGHQVLPTMAVGTLLLYAYTAVKRRGGSSQNPKQAKRSWGPIALAGLTTVVMIPFTWIFMVPTNNELFRLELVSRAEPAVKGLAEAKELVVKWAWLHLARSLFPLAGAVVGTVSA